MAADLDEHVDQFRHRPLGDAVPLCFLEADWPLIGGSFSVDGVQVLWPRLLVQRMTDAPPQPIDVDLIYARLVNVFPSA